MKQLGYTDMDELKKVIQWLVPHFGTIVIKNMDKKYAAVLEMLDSLGAVEVARQFEMMKDLTSYLS